MKKLLIINVTANWGSTGRIAEEIGQTALLNGYETYLAYGRYATKSKCNLIKIGSRFNNMIHLRLNPDCYSIRKIFIVRAGRHGA